MKFKKLLIVGIILVVLIGIVGLTYSFFSIGDVQDTANTFTSGCLNIELTNESSSINLNNIYPVTDIEGLKETSYDFTIKNNCSTPTTYQINLESLNEQANSLGADYIKVALSSDTVDPVISKLGNNPSATPEIEGAYESYNLYTTSIGAGEERTYHLKLWLDYDATVEQAASKVYQSKINVIANPEVEVVDTLEATFNNNHTTITSTLTNNVTSATYCISEGNICEPTTSAIISNHSYTIELEESETEKMVCTRLNGISKIICSNPLDVAPLCPEGASACNTILANAKMGEGTPDFSKTSCSVESNNGIDCGESTIGLYEGEENGKRIYYFRGDVDDNWVSFAGFYWRIIRTNSDGSIRMIYAGTDPDVTTGEGTQIGTSTFNSAYNASYYVGLKYTVNEQHGTTTDSSIMETLNTWYSNNLASYANQLTSGTGFCGDRDMASGYSWSAEPSDTIRYAAYERVITNKTPSLDCNTASDNFTTSGTGTGNGALQYPIGLITADEVALAGGRNGTINYGYYLYTGQAYWTMTPYSFPLAIVFQVSSNGPLNSYNIGLAECGVRPVINLRADVSLSGSGTSSDPYVVIG